MKTIRYEKRNNQRLLFDSNELPPGKNPFVHTCRPQIENPDIVQIRSFKVHRALEKIVVVGVVIGRAALRRKALSSCNFPSLESRPNALFECMYECRSRKIGDYKKNVFKAVVVRLFSIFSWMDRETIFRKLYWEGRWQISIGKGKFRSISQDEIISIRYRSKIALYLCKCVKF